MTTPLRQLLVTADDFGIGPETSRGILELAEQGAITSTVLLVNSPYAEDAVQQWQKAGSTLEIGWHPCLTLDRPLLPATQVPSLVNEEGKFFGLGSFLLRLMRGKIVEAEVYAELHAQYRRFLDLMGFVPININGHHHVHLFGPVQRSLLTLLRFQEPKPYIRRVGETWRTLLRVRGARLKRLWLNYVGQAANRSQHAAGFPGPDNLIGITDPACVESTHFFTRWLAAATGSLVELTCHPGHDDVTLLGRDATPTDGGCDRRVHEWYRLQNASFRQTAYEQGFQLVRAADLVTASTAEYRRVA